MSTNEDNGSKESKEPDYDEDKDSQRKRKSKKMKLENSTKKQQTAFSEFPIDYLNISKYY